MGRLSDYINGTGAGTRSAGVGAAGGNDMLGVEVNEAAAEAHLKALARMLTSDKDTRKRLQAVIRREIRMARNRTSKDIHGKLENDPRKAYMAIKNSVYKRVLGGNISILNSRKAGAPHELFRQRKIDLNPHQRGGNRMPMGDRTYKMGTYYGRDRSFVLRFLNSGTIVRYAGFGRNGKYNDRDSYDKFVLKTGGLGHRGKIEATQMFERFSTRNMDSAATLIAAAFEEEFAAVYNEEMNNQ